MSLPAYDACDSVTRLSEAFKLCPEFCNLSAFLALCQTSKQLKLQCRHFFNQPELLRQWLLTAILDVVDGHKDKLHDVQDLLYLCCEAWGPTALAGQLGLQKALIAAKDDLPLARLLIQAGARFNEEVMPAAAFTNNPGPAKWVQACSQLGIATSLPPHITSYCLDGLYRIQPQELTADDLFSFTAIALARDPSIEFLVRTALLHVPAAQAWSADQVKQLMQLILLQCKAKQVRPRPQLLHTLSLLPAAEHIPAADKQQLLESCAATCTLLHLEPLLPGGQLNSESWSTLLDASLTSASPDNCLEYLLEQHITEDLSLASFQSHLKLAIKQQTCDKLSVLLEFLLFWGESFSTEAAGQLLQLAAEQDSPADMLLYLLQADQEYALLPFPAGVLLQLLAESSHGSEAPERCVSCALMHKLLVMHDFELPLDVALPVVEALMADCDDQVLLGVLESLECLGGQELMCVIKRVVKQLPLLGPKGRVLVLEYVKGGLGGLVVQEWPNGRMEPSVYRLTNGVHLQDVVSVYAGALEQDDAEVLGVLAECEELLGVFEDAAVVKGLVLTCDTRGGIAAAGLRQALWSETPGGRELQEWHCKASQSPFVERYVSSHDRESMLEFGSYFQTQVRLGSGSDQSDGTCSDSWGSKSVEDVSEAEV